MVNEIYRDLGNLVNEQQTGVDEIEEMVTAASWCERIT